MLVVPLVLLVQPVAWVLGRVVVPVLVGVGVRNCLPRPVSPPQWLQGLALVEHRLLELLIENKLLALVVVVELVVEAVELLHARPAVGCCCPARCASFHVPPPHCSLLTAH